jgi:hypothetical protein
MEDTEHNGDCRFECRICFESVKEPVVTRCGHLFCWRCLYTWLEPGLSMEEYNFLGYRPVWRNIRIDRTRRVCPVCKKKCDVREVIPIYVKEVDQDSSISSSKHNGERLDQEIKKSFSDVDDGFERVDRTEGSQQPPASANVQDDDTTTPSRPHPPPVEESSTNDRSFNQPRNYSQRDPLQSQVFEAIIQEVNRQAQSSNPNATSNIPSLHHREENNNINVATAENDKMISLFLIIGSIFVFWILVS